MEKIKKTAMENIKLGEIFNLRDTMENKIKEKLTSIFIFGDMKKTKEGETISFYTEEEFLIKIKRESEDKFSFDFYIFIESKSIHQSIQGFFKIEDTELNITTLYI